MYPPFLIVSRTVYHIPPGKKTAFYSASWPVNSPSMAPVMRTVHELARLYLVIGGEIDAPVDVRAIRRSCGPRYCMACWSKPSHSTSTTVPMRLLVEIVHDAGLHVHHQLRPALRLGGVHPVQHPRPPACPPPGRRGTRPPARCAPPAGSRTAPRRRPRPRRAGR